MSRDWSTYRVVLAPIVVSCTQPAVALKAAREIAAALDAVKEELGIKDQSPPAVHVMGPRGGWRPVKGPRPRQAR